MDRTTIAHSCALDNQETGELSDLNASSGIGQLSTAAKAMNKTMSGR